MIPCRWRNRAWGAWWRSCLFCCFRFQLISSGAQLGRSGICVAFGVVFFYFGSVVGPCLYLDVVMLYSCIVWSGDCKPTMYLLSYSLHGLCEDYLTCDIAYNVVMPLSRALTHGRYSRIVGVTFFDKWVKPWTLRRWTILRKDHLQHVFFCA